MVKIRKADLTDIPRIIGIAHAVWPQAYGGILSPSQLHYMLEKFYSATSLTKQIVESGHQFILALNEESEAVAFASYSRHPGQDSVYHLHKIYVLSGLQKSNIGRYLLHYIMDEIVSGGATALRLNVNRHNPAKGFYEKMGFRVIRKEDIDIGSGYFMNDYVMERMLLPDGN